MNEENERSWGWWLLIPVLVLGFIVVQIAKAAMTSIFDKDK